MFQLDEAVTRVLQDVHNRDASLGDPWFQLIKDVYKVKPSSFADVLKFGIDSLARVTNRAKYRMNLNPDLSLTPLAAGVLMVGRTTPDQLAGVGKKFVEALGLAAAPPEIHRPFTALLEESTNPTDKKNKAGRLGQSILQAVYTAHRFYSILAHTDQYPLYPFCLVRSVLDDVVQSIKAAIDVIQIRRAAIASEQE